MSTLVAALGLASALAMSHSVLTTGGWRETHELRDHAITFSESVDGPRVLITAAAQHKVTAATAV